ncbi:mavicyanin-like [Punica granatum]|uniref:Phytocyanin domain-containing protein n=2 Tax=Punica granatum TaxID=22663 RepID=A0A218WHU8_PUNGR|nr:mavicyanin-like [Punica granatum]OWM72133.1 hypothetical protein CDL15_Pgr018016 [Punica granatum]PKI66266.1 hypothetical protein CRG98_013347 [Punica granatum]
MARTSSLAGLLLLGCTLAMMMGSARAITHVVGGSYGWQVPETSDFYEKWASRKKVTVGDKLIFPYSPGSNNLLVVKKEEYDHCTQNCPIETYYLGPTIINITRPGDYFYISSFGKHCDYGQRLHIIVCDGKGSTSGHPHPSKPARHLLATSSPVNAPAPSPSAAAAATIGATAVVSGIVASFVSLLM